MLHETKVGVVVACSFLGLVGAVVTLKYHGDPLAAAGLESADVADNSFLTEPIPLPVHEANSDTPANPIPGAAGPGLENLGSGHGLQLVSTTGEPKPPPSLEATPRPIRARRTKPRSAGRPRPKSQSKARQRCLVPPANWLVRRCPPSWQRRARSKPWTKVVCLRLRQNPHNRPRALGPNMPTEMAR